MAPLTWRNVDRGNFGDSVAALRLSGDLLSRGFDRADTALSDFDTWRTEQNDRTAMASASRIQDPNAFRSALAAGTAFGGVPATGLSTRTLAALDARAGALTERDAAAYANNRTQSTNAAEDAASPAIAALSAAARSGDPAAIATAQRGLSLAGVPLARVLEINRSLGLIEGQAVTTAGGRIQNAGQVIQNDGRRVDNEAARFRLDEARRGSADQQAAAAAVQNVLDSAADTTGARNRFGEVIRDSNLSPTATGLARGLLQNYFPDLYAPVGTNPTTGAVAPGSRPAATAAIAASVAPGAGPPPVGSSVIAAAIPDNGVRADGTRNTETRDYVQRITRDVATRGIQLTGDPDRDAALLAPIVQQRESSNDPTAVSRAGAQGLMQLMPDTARELERRLGMREGLTSENTPEGHAANQRAGTQYLADQLRANNGNLELALASYNAGPNRVAGWRRDNPAFEAAVASNRNSARLTGVQEGNREARTQAQADQNRDGSQTGAGRFAAAMSDEQTNRLLPDLVRGIRALPEFSGVSANYLERQIRRVMQEGNVSASVAAEIITRNNVPQTEGFWNSVGSTAAAALSRVTGISSLRPEVNLPGGRQLNRAGIEADIQTWGGQAGTRAVQQQNNRAAALLRLQQAEAAATQAVSAFEQFKTRAQGQPALIGELARYQAAADAALATAERLRQQEALDSNASRGNRRGTSIPSTAFR